MGNSSSRTSDVIPRYNRADSPCRMMQKYDGIVKGRKISVAVKKRKRKRRVKRKKERAAVPEIILDSEDFNIGVPTLEERKDAKGEGALAYIFTLRGETPEKAIVMDKFFGDSLDEFYGTVTEAGNFVNGPDFPFRSYLMFDIMEAELKKMRKFGSGPGMVLPRTDLLKAILRLTLTFLREDRWRVDPNDSERAQALMPQIGTQWRHVFFHSNEKLGVTAEDREGLIYFLEFFKKEMSDCPCELEFSITNMSFEV